MARHGIGGAKFGDGSLRNYKESLSLPRGNNLGSLEPWRMKRGAQEAQRKQLAAVADTVLRREGEFPLPDDILGRVVEAERFTVNALANNVEPDR